MFTRRNVPAILQSATLDVEQDKKLASCKLHIYPFTYDLAKEMHAEIADRLFRPIPMPQWNSKTAEFEPCLKMNGVTFEPLLPDFEKQRMEFRNGTGEGASGGIVPSVSVESLKANLFSGLMDFTLVLGIRFEITDRMLAALYLVEQFRQTCYLTFQPMQKPLFETQTVGELANQRAKDKTLTRIHKA